MRTTLYAMKINYNENLLIFKKYSIGQVSGTNTTCAEYTYNNKESGNIYCPPSSPGTICDYKSDCTVGYIPSNNVVCLSNGSWSATPECIGKYNLVCLFCQKVRSAVL